MSPRWNRLETWAALGVIGAGAGLAAILSLPLFMSATATRLHPEPQSVPSVTSAAPPARWAAAVGRARQAVRAALSEENLTGLSVAVGVENDLVWAEGFGWAELDGRAPVTPDTRFRIGTASAVLTSAAVGVLVEEGRLKLDEPVQTYVPEFPVKPWPVTLRQVMGHLAGLGSDGGDESPLFSRHCERPADALRAFADRPLRFEPGTRFRFSNYGWIVVSAAVEAAAGQPFLAFMRERVFEPLGMDDTTADAPAEEVPNLATFYFPRFMADPRYGLHPMRPIDLSCYAGSMVFVSTSADLVRFGLGISRGALLRPETVRLLQTSQRLASGQETGYGLGWDLETVTLAGERVRMVGHDGESLGGMVGSFMVVPDRGLVVAVLSNISYAGTFSLALKVADAFAEAARRSAPE